MCCMNHCGRNIFGGIGVFRSCGCCCCQNSIRFPDFNGCCCCCSDGGRNDDRDNTGCC